MPELPEVEVSAQIAATALRQSYVSKVWLKPCKLFRLPKSKEEQRPNDPNWLSDVNGLERLLTGAQAIDPYTLRYGKLMASVFHAQDGRAVCLFARLGMTGKYISGSVGDELRSGIKLSLELSDRSTQGASTQRLDFINTRMFGSIWAQISKREGLKRPAVSAFTSHI